LTRPHADTRQPAPTRGAGFDQRDGYAGALVCIEANRPPSHLWLHSKEARRPEGMMSDSFTLTSSLSDRDSWTAADWCPMERALGLIGTRSAMTLLREVFYGATRFDDLARRAGVTPAVASQRLRQLVDNGLLERRPYQEPGQRTRYEYAVTQGGLEVFPIIAALSSLGDRLPREPEKAVVLRHADCGEPVMTEVRCAAGHPVAPADTVVSIVQRTPSTRTD
jgi:DNA-binding HxlR family transcriptional regulator